MCGQRFVHESLHRHRLAVQRQDARFDARHIEKIGHESSQAVRLDLNQPVEQRTVLGREELGAAGQRGGCNFDGGERRAQVVGHRAQQSAPETVGLFEEFGCAGPARVVRARSRARAASLAKVLTKSRSVSSDRDATHGEDARARPDPESAMVRSSLESPAMVPTRTGRPGVRVELGEFLGAQRLAGACLDDEAPCSSSSSETPGTLKTLWAVLTMFLESSSTG